MNGPSVNDRVRLENQNVVASIIDELERKICRPIIRHFKLNPCTISEQSPDARKAGVTLRKLVPAGSAGDHYVFSIRVRIRSRDDPVRKMLSRGTHIAVTLHELAHLRFLNHGPEFAMFLREIFIYARTRLGLFDSPLYNQIPSPWEWERAIWDTKGDADAKSVARLHAAWWETQGK